MSLKRRGKTDVLFSLENVHEERLNETISFLGHANEMHKEKEFHRLWKRGRKYELKKREKKKRAT